MFEVIGVILLALALLYMTLEACRYYGLYRIYKNLYEKNKYYHLRAVPRSDYSLTYAPVLFGVIAPDSASAFLSACYLVDGEAYEIQQVL
jgi:hypothetical protein